MSKLITLIVHNFEAPIVPYLFFGLWVVCSLLIALVAISDRMEAGKPPNVAGQLISGVVGGVFMAAH